jgi:peptide/nickel transport system substrate-binding protein
MPKIAARAAYFLVAAACVAAMCGAAQAQKSGGILHLYHRDSPASLSLMEESSISVAVPAMGIFNNLVMYDPKVKVNSLASIIPDLAESWAWDEGGTALTFKLRSGVKWHDGVQFTAADVKCTWDLLIGKSKDKLRVNPRAAWWRNLDEVTTEGDREATFHLKRPQPSILAMIASGMSPVYPCHIPPAQMRQHPIGTGPFKFVEYKPNQDIKVARNPDYWKPGRPYLDGIEYTIIPNRSTAMLALVAGQIDMTFPNEVTPPLMHDLHEQLPQAICETVPTHDAPSIQINRTPPFDKPELRRAIMLTIDHKAYIDILGEGQGDIGTAFLPGPEGQWAMPKEMMDKLPGYGPDVAKNRDEARGLMKGLGYGPDHHLPVTIVVKNVPSNRDPGAIFIDQLKQIWIDGELEPVETANLAPRLMRGQFTMAIQLVGSAIDDPDQTFDDDYVCGSPRNYIHYCDKEVGALIDQQSSESDIGKRRKIVWEIDKRLQEQAIHPIFAYMRAGTCWRPDVKGLTITVNSQYNNWRFEDVWLDR